MGTPLTKMNDKEEVKRKPLTKEEVQQIANQLTENSIEELEVTSENYSMYDGGDRGLCFKVIFNCCYLLYF